MRTEIFVMTHKPYNETENPIYKTLHVGRALAENSGYMGDDTGDNISRLNPYYCELTGLYWLWKNYDCDYIGICHYRRFFVRNQQMLSKEYIESTLQRYDIILPYSQTVPDKNVMEHYEKKHILDDLLLCRQVIRSKYPEYADAFDFCMDSKVFSMANMMITSKSIFDSYCRWLFDILFEVWNKIDLNGRDDYQKRVMGFLSERLIRVWLMKHTYKIKEEKVQMMDADEADKHQKRRSLVYRILSLMTTELVSRYQKGINVKLPPISADVGLDGRIPVWICRWHGLENAPDLVKKCVESIRRHFPDSMADIRIITFENYMRYVEFSQNVVDKFNSGKITEECLSDILQAQLLYRYGGLWIDASYFITDDRAQELLTRTGFYCQKSGKSDCDDIIRGRWSWDLIMGNAGFELFGFVMEAFELYLASDSEFQDYFTVDYFIAIAYDNIQSVRNAIDVCPVNNPRFLELSEISNRIFCKERFDKISRDTYAFKMNCREDYRKSNIAGQPTFFGKIIL